MKELIEAMAAALVDYPGEIRINEISGGQTTILELSVAKADLGKIIGKQGRNAAALRTILNGASAKTKRRAVLEIVE